MTLFFWASNILGERSGGNAPIKNEMGAARTLKTKRR